MVVHAAEEAARTVRVPGSPEAGPVVAARVGSTVRGVVTPVEVPGARTVEVARGRRERATRRIAVEVGWRPKAPGSRSLASPRA